MESLNELSRNAISLITDNVPLSDQTLTDLINCFLQGYTPDCIETINSKILGWSAKNGHLSIVKFLVKNGINIHTRNDYALRMSAENGHFAIVKFLVKKGADVHAINDYALRWSAEKGHLLIVKFLVKNGADIHADNDYPLKWSSANGHFAVVKFLVEKHANIHTNDVLRLSARNGHLDIVRFLIDQGVDIFANNNDALKWSAINGHLAVVELLVDCGAYIDANNILYLSASNGRTDVFNYLTKCHAKKHTSLTDSKTRNKINKSCVVKFASNITSQQPVHNVTIASTKIQTVDVLLPINTKLYYTDDNNNRIFIKLNQELAHKLPECDVLIGNNKFCIIDSTNQLNKLPVNYLLEHKVAVPANTQILLNGLSLCLSLEQEFTLEKKPAVILIPKTKLQDRITNCQFIIETAVTATIAN